MEKKKYIKRLNLNTISLIDLKYLTETEVIPKSVNEIVEYYNELFDITKDYHKQFFYHNFIKTVCDIYNKEKTYFSYVFYYNPQNNILDQEIEQLINKLNKTLPLVFYCDKLPFECIDDKFISGEMQELKEKLKIQIDKKNKKDFSFRSIKSFAKKYKLTFLSEEYFNDLKVKHGLYK